MADAHISLVTLGVADIPAATRFYEALGWRRSPVSTDDVSFLSGGTVVLALWSANSIGEDAGLEAPHPAAYATNVFTQQEVDEHLARAAEAGATVTKAGAPTEWGGYTGYFTDPDGHLWEVAHNPGFPLGDEGQVYLPPSDEQQQEAEAAAAAIDAGLVEFIEAAGDHVHERADEVLSILDETWARIDALTSEDTNNVVLAVMLELSRRSRSIDPREAAYWRASAASTLMSGLHGERRDD